MVTVVVANRTEILAAIRLAVDFESLGRNEQGLPEYRHRKTGLVMVLVPGGRFQMGSAEGDLDARPNEHPRHEVAVDPFLISKYEVSHSSWQRMSGIAPGRVAESSAPATQISWDDCGRVLEEAGLRLPTEAEWECAARANGTTAFCFGDELPDSGTGALSGIPMDVASGAPNAFGLHHVHGNVAEWCADDYEFSIYSRLESTGRNPITTGVSEWRVVRGGSFQDEAADTRSGFRARFQASQVHATLGLRPAISYYRERTPRMP